MAAMNACIQPSKQEATRPAGMTSLQQRASFDDFVNAFNVERPHEAIMKRPAEVYIPSGRLYQGLPQLDDPFHDKAVIVTTCGRIGFNTRKINLSQSSLATWSELNRSTSAFGSSPSCTAIWDTSTMRHADWSRRSPLRTQSVTYVSGIIRNLCLRYGPK